MLLATLVIIGILNIRWRFAAGQATAFFCLLSVLAYNALKTYPERTLMWHHLFKVDGKTTLNGCWPMKMLISYSISNSFTLICIALLVSECAFSAILCFMCTKRTEKCAIKSRKQGFLQFGEDYKGFIRIRNVRGTQSSLDLFGSGVY